MCHMYMTDFAFDGPIFLVPLSLSYPSSPVLSKGYFFIVIFKKHGHCFVDKIKIRSGNFK